MAKKLDIPKDNNIIDIPLEEAMPENYLPYAVEVAKDRALPDVRDGLKPVHRRIIYGAYMLKAFPDKPYFKSARIVGDILGKYHPHGDASVYDAMVILAQNFSTREPLIDGHGNWGSIDGDNAAAMRYTEAKLTPIALEMIRDIDKEIVDMVPNYSDTEMEPKVLPGRYPNLLVNGTFGIAVGLATNIPPHNLKEVIDATVAYIDDEEITTKGLMNYIKGPDLPTGGILIGKDSLLAAYETGEGKVTLRAKTSIEKLENGRWGIVITEFPYRRNKAKLLQTISEMTADKKHMKALEAITDIRDESDRTGIRAVIELKKAADEDMANKILKYLYKKTDLQCNVNFNMVALADGKPETLGLKAIIKHYVLHQKDIITRRTRRELDLAEKRFHIVEGFIKAISIMDEIIATIRASKSKKDASENLINKFDFSEEQAQAILELMLYRLTGLEIKTFEKEYKELEKLIKRLNKILENEKELLKVIKEEILQISEKHGSARRTEIVQDDSEAKIDLDELVVVEDVMVTLSKEGFIKRVPLKSYNRLNSNLEDIEYREGDYARFLFQSNTKDSLTIFTDKGNMYQIKCNNIPECKWKEKGERLDELIKGLSLNEENILVAFSIDNFSPSKELLFFTNRGAIKKTSLIKFETSYSKLQALKLREGEALVKVELVEAEREEKFIRVLTKNGLSFSLEEPKLEPLERAVLGTQMILMPIKDEIVSVEYVEEYEYAEFTLGINKYGKIKVYDKVKEDSYRKVRTNSKEKILIFADNAKAYLLSACLFQNLKDEEFDLRNLVEGFEEEHRVLNMLSIDSFEEELYIYFFTNSGMVKRSLLKEFAGEYLEIQSYKYKQPKDKLIAIEFSNNEGSKALLVTKKAMAIKFSVSDISVMGRIASGVTGISLKDEDEVIFAKVTDSYNTLLKKVKDEVALDKENSEEITLVASNKQEKTFNVDEIRLQNRAGRGTNLMLVIMGIFITKVKNKK